MPRFETLDKREALIASGICPRCSFRLELRKEMIAFLQCMMCGFEYYGKTEPKKPYRRRVR